MKSQFTLPKALRKSEDITARYLLSAFDILIKSSVMGSVCNIVFFGTVLDSFLTYYCI